MTQTLQDAGHLSEEQLNAFVDGELSASELRRVEQHVAECHACALRVLSATRLKTATAAAAQQVEVPSDALARLTAQLRTQEPLRPQAAKTTGRFYTFPSARWAAIAASAVFALSLIGWQTRQANTLSAELLDQHLSTLSSGAAPEVISTDRHTVKPWFQGKLPFSFNLPEVLPADTTLKGGDLVYVDGEPAALLLFTIHKHQVSVFLTQRSHHLAALERSVTRSGFMIHYATTQELRIAAVSDVNPAELDGLITSLVKVQSPQ
jgi:anti-sigma factor RsiW